MAEWKERESDRYSHDKWYENIWYHHKFHIIIGAILIVVIAILFYSSNMNDPTDMYILYITETPEVYTEKTDALTNALTQYAEDKNGDGKVVLMIENLYVGEEFDSANVYTNKEKIMTALRSGDCMFIISDDAGAQYLAESEACADLTSKIPEEHGGTLEFNNTAWNWNGSEFKESNTQLKNIFGNLELYFSTRIYEGTIAELTENSRENHELAENLLNAIVTNTKPE